VTRYAVGRLRTALGAAQDADLPTAQRGRALEDLAAFLFGSIPGVSVFATNSVDVFTSQEIDVVLDNLGHANGLLGFEREILIECKNWSDPVGSNEVAWFDTKLRTRGLRHGFLLAMNGITGNAYARTSAHNIIAMALIEQRRIVVITGDDLAQLRSTQQLVSLCRTRMAQMLLSRGLP
jgi:hypothetical protein